MCSRAHGQHQQQRERGCATGRFVSQLRQTFLAAEYTKASIAVDPCFAQFKCSQGSKGAGAASAQRISQT
eukprot:773908-Pelagomonas_calceolata.AAC.2